MPLFIDRLPFDRWTDPTRMPALTYWTVVLPFILTEPTVLTAPPVAGVQEWVVDTGNRGEAFAWRWHPRIAMSQGADRNRLRYRRRIGLDAGFTGSMTVFKL